MYTEGISILVAENMKREQKILTTKSKSVKQCFTRFRHGRSWCRGGSGGARDSQLFFGYAVTGMFSKIHSTEDRYIIRVRISSSGILPFQIYWSVPCDHALDFRR